ncbi:MAG: hypothetical protein ACO1NS_13565 [Daejeonella sp.]|uniref:hypothetical protein n=1 Tax=Daejeonella sp. JGW-45 TaxID=3034148 RepID=UPI0023EC3293|nr:hypothetical protein [Daejeonella sp. JGW-45]
MHPISDKELDKLFQRHFEEADFQPSESVWGKIAAKMDRKEKAKRPLPLFWMAAASILVVVGAGLWFGKPEEVIKLQGMPKQLTQEAGGNSVDVVAPEAPLIEPEQTIIKGFDFSKLATSQQDKSAAPEEVTLPEKVMEEAPKQELTALNNSRKSTADAPQSDKNVRVPRYTGDQSQLDVTQPDMIASTEVSENDLVPEHTAAPAKRVRGIGGIINLVISKVDPREDKIIEFKDGSEGSEVSGINLGLIRLKSRNR